MRKTYASVAINDESAWDGQSPGSVPIALLEVNSGASKFPACRFVDDEGEPVEVSDLVAAIRQHREGELVSLRSHLPLIRAFWGDGHERAAGRRNFRQGLDEAVKIDAAVGTPGTAKEHENH